MMEANYKETMCADKNQHCEVEELLVEASTAAEQELERDRRESQDRLMEMTYRKVVKEFMADVLDIVGEELEREEIEMQCNVETTDDEILNETRDIGTNAMEPTKRNEQRKGSLRLVNDGTPRRTDRQIVKPQTGRLKCVLNHGAHRIYVKQILTVDSVSCSYLILTFFSGIGVIPRPVFSMGRSQTSENFPEQTKHCNILKDVPTEISVINVSAAEVCINRTEDNNDVFDDNDDDSHDDNNNVKADGAKHKDHDKEKKCDKDGFDDETDEFDDDDFDSSAKLQELIESVDGSSNDEPANKSKHVKLAWNDNQNEKKKKFRLGKLFRRIFRSCLAKNDN